MHVQVDETGEQVLAIAERHKAPRRAMACRYGSRLRSIPAMDRLDNAAAVRLDQDAGKELDPAARGCVQRVAEKCSLQVRYRGHFNDRVRAPSKSDNAGTESR